MAQHGNKRKRKGRSSTRLANVKNAIDSVATCAEPESSDIGEAKNKALDPPQQGACTGRQFKKQKKSSTHSERKTEGEVLKEHDTNTICAIQETITSVSPKPNDCCIQERDINVSFLDFLFSVEAWQSKPYQEKDLQGKTSLGLKLKKEELINDPISWLNEQELIPPLSTHLCRKCGTQLILKENSKYLDKFKWMCANSKCRKLHTIPRSKLFAIFKDYPLSDLIAVVYHWSFQSGYEELRKDCILELHDIVRVWKSVQDVCAREMHDCKIGLKNPVEVSYITCCEFLIVGAMERGTCISRLAAFPLSTEVSSPQVTDALTSFIHTGTRVITDLPQKEELSEKGFVIADRELIECEVPSDHVHGLLNYLHGKIKAFESCPMQHLNLELLQMILNNLQWRELYGRTIDDAFWNIIYQVSGKKYQLPHEALMNENGLSIDSCNYELNESELACQKNTSTDVHSIQSLIAENATNDNEVPVDLSREAEPSVKDNSSSCATEIAPTSNVNDNENVENLVENNNTAVEIGTEVTTSATGSSLELENSCDSSATEIDDSLSKIDAEFDPPSLPPQIENNTNDTTTDQQSIDATIDDACPDHHDDENLSLKTQDTPASIVDSEIDNNHISDNDHEEMFSSDVQKDQQDDNIQIFNTDKVEIMDLISIKTWPFLYQPKRFKESLTVMQADFFTDLRNQNFFRNPERWLLLQKFVPISGPCLSCGSTDFAIKRCTNSVYLYGRVCANLRSICPISLFQVPKLLQKQNLTLPSILKLIYHWTAQSDVEDVLESISAESNDVWNIYSEIRQVCSSALSKTCFVLGKDKSVVMSTIVHCGPYFMLVCEDVKTNLNRMKLYKIDELKGQSVVQDLKSWCDSNALILGHFPPSVEKHMDCFSHLSDSVIVCPANNVQHLMELSTTVINNLFNRCINSYVDLHVMQALLDEVMWRQIYGVSSLYTLFYILKQIIYCDERSKRAGDENVFDDSDAEDEKSSFISLEDIYTEIRAKNETCKKVTFCDNEENKNEKLLRNEDDVSNRGEKRKYRLSYAHSNEDGMTSYSHPKRRLQKSNSQVVSRDLKKRSLPPSSLWSNAADTPSLVARICEGDISLHSSRRDHFTCLECRQLMSSSHKMKSLTCHCSYSSFCVEAFVRHTHRQTPLNEEQLQSFPLDTTGFCQCGFSSEDGMRLALHLQKCGHRCILGTVCPERWTIEATRSSK